LSVTDRNRKAKNWQGIGSYQTAGGASRRVVGEIPTTLYAKNAMKGRDPVYNQS